MNDIKENTQTLEERYIRLYKFTRDVLMANNLPKEFDENYEIKLAEETIKKIKNDTTN